MPEGHQHAHGQRAGNAGQRRALWIALVLNGGFLAAEVVGGLVFGSLALLADAAHMLSDVAGLAIALVAAQLMSRAASHRHSYGLQRAEVLGAQANALTLLAVAGYIVIEAVRRLDRPDDVSGLGVLVVASLGLSINAGSAVLLARAAGRSLHMRGAVLHMVLDAAGSVAAIIAGATIFLGGPGWIDPALSIVIAALVIWSGFGLLRQTTRVLLESAPDDVDTAEVEAALLAEPDISGVHHLHLWTVSSELTALSGHIVLEGEPTLHAAQSRGDDLRALLGSKFGIGHATLELECHTCVGDDCAPAVHP